jgi:alpha-L-rhamnosidase
MQNSRHIEWDAEWIGLPSGEIPPGEHRSLLARYLRREFIVSKPLKRAIARVCGLGVFDFG